MGGHRTEPPLYLPRPPQNSAMPSRPLILSFGNTTVRNPTRLKPALDLIASEFVGKPWDYENQGRFLKRFAEQGYFAPSDNKAAEQYEQHGRTWGSTLYQFGFLRNATAALAAEGRLLELTPIGEALVQAQEELELQELWLRQLLKFQFPHPYADKGEGAEIIPFFEFLRFLAEVKYARKEDIGYFFLTSPGSKEVDRGIRALLEFRKAAESIRGRNEKEKARQVAHREYFHAAFSKEWGKELQAEVVAYLKAPPAKGAELLEDLVRGGKGSKTKRAEEIKGIIRSLRKKSNPADQIISLLIQYHSQTAFSRARDYGDAAARYCGLSGLLVNKGQAISISPLRQELVAEILKHPADVYPLKNDRDKTAYLAHLWAPDQPVLPLDDPRFLRGMFHRVTGRLVTVPETKTPAEMRAVRKKLYSSLANDKKQRLKEYAQQLQHSPRYAEEVGNYFDEILGRRVLGDGPTHFEWNVWRALLVIDHFLGPVENTCRFPLDDSLGPVSTAGGGRAEMEFEFPDFVLVVEVTLSTGQQQRVMEYESVPRHVGEAEGKRKDQKPVYGLFVANRLHPNAMGSFWTHTRGDTAYLLQSGQREVFPKIIPIEVSVLQRILAMINQGMFSFDVLKDFIIRSADSARVLSQRTWAERIAQDALKTFS